MRALACLGDKTTYGNVISASATWFEGNKAIAQTGDLAQCSKCKGAFPICGTAFDWSEQQPYVATGDRVLCGCPDHVVYGSTTQYTTVAPSSIAPIQPNAAPQTTTNSRASTSETATHTPTATRPTNFTSAPVPSSGLTETIESACEKNWRFYQKQAEDFIAPGGKLIADPKVRNQKINSAYAQLWQSDNRFQWAGLAAFASKQVGCGLLHASESIEKIQAEYEAAEQLKNSARAGVWGLFSAEERERKAKLLEYEKRQREYEQANRNNPVPSVDIRSEGEPLSSVQQRYQHVYEMMALGNTTLFLDVFPLHAFYKDRGLKLLETCLPFRKNLSDDGQHPVLWPIGKEKLEFGTNQKEILQAFEAIDAGNIAESVVHMAWHEQQNILQPTMYTDQKLVWLLRGNHLSYVTSIPSGVAQAIELTLASQCRPISDGRTIEFSNNYTANLADIDQRMTFVLKAAEQFDELLHSTERPRIEQAIDDIAKGKGVQ